MHVILVEELVGTVTAYPKEHPEKDDEAERRVWDAALKRSFERADALGMGQSASGWPIMGSAHHRGGAPGARQKPRRHLWGLPRRALPRW